MIRSWDFIDNNILASETKGRRKWSCRYYMFSFPSPFFGPSRDISKSLYDKSLQHYCLHIKILLRQSKKGKTTHLSKEHKAITYALSSILWGSQGGTVPLSIFPVRNLNKTNQYENHHLFFNRVAKRTYYKMDWSSSFAYILVKFSFFMESGIPPVKLLKLKSLQDQKNESN
jgi:hypothetical protein